MKNFIVSDVHDHYGLLLEALSRNGFDQNNGEHRLILCGDAFYSGPEPGELFTFLRELHKKGRLIFIYGNHDVELLDNLNARRFTRPTNRKCAALLVEYLTGERDLTDDELLSECDRLGFTDFLASVPVWYYENENYVFTHAFIPTVKRAYNPNWRSSTDEEWRGACRSDAMLLSMKHRVRVPEKIIVCGHFSAARCYLMKDAMPADWENKIYKDVSHVPPEGFKTFFGDTFIALDGSVKKSGFVNCVVISHRDA